MASRRRQQQGTTSSRNKAHAQQRHHLLQNLILTVLRVDNSICSHVASQCDARLTSSRYFVLERMLLTVDVVWRHNKRKNHSQPWPNTYYWQNKLVLIIVLTSRLLYPCWLLVLWSRCPSNWQDLFPIRLLCIQSVFWCSLVNWSQLQALDLRCTAFVPTFVWHWARITLHVGTCTSTCMSRTCTSSLFFLSATPATNCRHTLTMPCEDGHTGCCLCVNSVCQNSPLWMALNGCSDVTVVHLIQSISTPYIYHLTLIKTDSITELN